MMDWRWNEINNRVDVGLKIIINNNRNVHMGR